MRIQLVAMLEGFGIDAQLGQRSRIKASQSLLNNQVLILVLFQWLSVRSLQAQPPLDGASVKVVVSCLAWVCRLREATTAVTLYRQAFLPGLGDLRCLRWRGLIDS
jgi:hypothetical protein